MLYLLISIVGILITIFFVIGTHESAHFLMARLFGIKVLRFSIGFGKTLWRWQDKKGTEYVFALIPLGGYVKMLDENEGDVPKESLHLAYNRQPFYKKFLVVLAGPTSNILCALILYWIIFTVGFTTVKPVIGEVNPRSIAAEGGITSNREIISVDDEPTATWNSFLLRLVSHAGNDDHIKIETIPFPEIKSGKADIQTLDLSSWHLDSLSPDPLTSIGIIPFSPNIPLVIGMISPDSPIASRLKINDKLLAINRQPIKNWAQLHTFVINHPSESVIFTLEREGKILNLPIQIGEKKTLLLQTKGYLGIGPNFKWPPELLRKVQYSPLDALGYAGKEVWNFTRFNVILFSKLITGKLSIKSLGGPISIFQTAGDALNGGWLIFLGFLAFLSISIGIINLLPIPGLDGGHLFIQILEAIYRKPIPQKYLLLLYRLGFIFIIFILFQSLMNDILRMY